MNLNKLFKTFLKKREKNINVVNDYFDNIYNVNDNSYYANTNQCNNYYQQSYEIPRHDVFLLEDIKQIPPNDVDVCYCTQVEYFNPSAPPSPPLLSEISKCENDLNIRSISDEDFFKDNSECCSICLCDFKEMKTITLTNCHHKFHFKCIKEWLSENNRCPLCNEDQTKLKKRFNF